MITFIFVDIPFCIARSFHDFQFWKFFWINVLHLFLLFFAETAESRQQADPGDVAGLEKGSEGRIGLREKNVGKNCINSRNLSVEVQSSEKFGQSSW